MFAPDEVIFALTPRCNLRCSHCRVSRHGEDLDSQSALRFLLQCQKTGIDRVGFSGGEPFLALKTLCALVETAVANNMVFDRLMTNGCWWQSRAELEEALNCLATAGFDGTIGLSYDSYHGQDPETMASFIQAAHEAFNDKGCLEIISVRSSADAAFIEDLFRLAKLLKAQLVLDGQAPIAISGQCDPSIETAAHIDIPIIRFNCSPPASEAAWEAEEWFVDDYCAGPGNVFYVHPDGRVAACCGFANENDGLILGSIQDSIPTLLDQAKQNPMITVCYRTGLAAYRKQLEARGLIFPGKTQDLCFFCDWLYREGLVEA